MKKILWIALACSVCLLGSAIEVDAQGCGNGDIPLGDLYLSFASDIYDRYLGTAGAPGGDPGDTPIGAFSPFNFYLVADIDYCDCGNCGLNFNKGFQAWEARLDLSAIPAGDLIILSARLNPDSSNNFGSPVISNFLVGTGGACVFASQSPYALVTFQALIGNSLGASDLRIDLTEALPASRLSPGWNQCAPPDGILYSFKSVEDGPEQEGYEENFIVINPTDLDLPPDPGATAVLTIESGFVAEGDTTNVTVLLRDSSIPKLGLATVAGVDFDLTWDPSVATLLNVAPSTETTNWLVQANIQSGFASISMATGQDAIDVALAEIEILTLGFEGTPDRGQTTILPSETRVFDIAQVPVPHVSVAGVLEVGCDEAEVVRDGEINSADAILTLQFAVDLQQPDPREFCAADVNEDQQIDTGDGILVLRRAVGLPRAVSSGVLPASLSLLNAYGPGEMMVHAEGAAGIQGALAYDPESLEFRSASLVQTAGLLTVNSSTPGILQFALAQPMARAATVLVVFEPLKESALVTLTQPAAFDESGISKALDIVQGQSGVDVTVVGAPPARGQRRGARIVSTYPNPFNPATTISYHLPKAAPVLVTAYDAAGREVWRLPKAWVPAGLHELVWDGTDASGARVASGVYRIVLRSGETSDTVRISLVK